MVVIARDEDEPYVAGDEGVGNRRDGPAFEMGVEDGKIEIGFPRRFQRLVNAPSFGGDGIADLKQGRSLVGWLVVRMNRIAQKSPNVTCHEHENARGIS